MAVPFDEWGDCFADSPCLSRVAVELRQLPTNSAASKAWEYWGLCIRRWAFNPGRGRPNGRWFDTDGIQAVACTLLKHAQKFETLCEEKKTAVDALALADSLRRPRRRETPAPAAGAAAFDWPDAPAINGLVEIEVRFLALMALGIAQQRTHYTRLREIRWPDRSALRPVAREPEARVGNWPHLIALRTLVADLPAPAQDVARLALLSKYLCHQAAQPGAQQGFVRFSEEPRLVNTHRGTIHPELQATLRAKNRHAQICIDMAPRLRLLALLCGTACPGPMRAAALFDFHPDEPANPWLELTLHTPTNKASGTEVLNHGARNDSLATPCCKAPVYLFGCAFARAVLAACHRLDAPIRALTVALLCAPRWSGFPAAFGLSDFRPATDAPAFFQRAGLLESDVVSALTVAKAQAAWDTITNEAQAWAAMSPEGALHVAA